LIISIDSSFRNDNMAYIRKVKLISFAIVALVIIGGAYVLGVRTARTTAQESSARQLQIISLDVESILQRYETLPFALSFQSEAISALQKPELPEPIDQLNRTLEAIHLQARVAAIYLMDANGKTIAASNWNTGQSYIGKNFGFRPYFLDALQGKAGRFYGIGSTTAEPGYFIAQPVYMPIDGSAKGAGTVIGVIAVKISLNDFSSAWRSIVEPVALADRWGVIFIGNRPLWQYHSLERLTPLAQEEIAKTLQYVGHHIEPVRSLPSKVQSGFTTPVTYPVGVLGWQLMMFPNQAMIRRNGMFWAFTSALLLSLVGISILASHQRKRRLEERGLARTQLQKAAEDLDRKIILRTAELTAANQSIESKYAKLKETEYLLRNTQNELVQAGKLTMLGQMAAGVTHELSQPLTAIRAFSDNAKTFLERGQTDKAAENLSLISAASERMGAIIGQLKGFARKSDPSVAALSAVNLAESIYASARLLENDFQRYACKLEILIQDEVQLVGDPIRIEQVLINLLRNAMEATETSLQKSVFVSLKVKQAQAMICIRDTGNGIADGVAPHLFEPFYTTKVSGKGLGLGLAISSSIVQAMNGQLSAQNHPEGGAEFTLTLPLHAPPLSSSS
jgi:two-component system C4-dicarboxylate transport sensor histidine kinase DctB